ncbi:hypothetical protein EV183_004807 [Coemansia sp. RSA 2336]|nr:hypothetical protein EV183_004807 [Coemansia sp. RSA 2336]
MQWVEHKASCPLCKRNLTAIIQPTDSIDRIHRTPINQVTRKPKPTYTYGSSPARADLLGLRKRESVYQHNLHRTSSTNRRISTSPHLLKQEIDSRRCREWIHRDLQVILAHEDVEIIALFVVGLVRERGSLDVEADLEVLGNKARLFLDELEGFVNSTLEMPSYDLYSVYVRASGLE